MDSFFSSLFPPCYRGILKCHVGRMIHVSSFIHSWHVEVLGLQVRLTARLWRLGGRSPCSSLLLVTPAVNLAIALIQMVASSSTGPGAGWPSRSQDKGCTLWYPQFRFLSSPDSAPGSSKLPQSLGFDSIPADPAGQVLSASCSAKSVSGAIYLVLLTFLVAFLSYGFLLVLADLFLLLKTCLHSPSSRGNRHGWYSVSILTVSSMCLLS